MNARFCAAGFLWAIVSMWSQAHAATAIRFGGNDAELSICSISDRTVRIELSPIAADGKPIPPAPSTVLVPFSSSAGPWKARELSGDKELRLGKLRVLAKAQPLAIV